MKSVHFRIISLQQGPQQHGTPPPQHSPFNSCPAPNQGARGRDMTNHTFSRSPQPHQRPSCLGNESSIPNANRTAKPSRSSDKRSKLHIRFHLK
ncbi:hypothetical protein Nepgr_011607 [Nepenthes gracilis]|uniref:Uncharacterized protein n=1 Tax=Nepenthes gracilis TaxID=150966 RepID=A0AAD3XMI9_NEPGR|nr:hypothetical protein Nepgr_011607 [Nepenthes gracilis]